MSAERAERATQRKRQQARRRGMIPRSRELASALVILALTGLLAWNPWILLREWKAFFRAGLDAAVSEDVLAAGPLLVSMGWTAFAMGGLFLIAIWFVAVLGMTAQEGVVFASQPVQPRTERLNPAVNLKNLFSPAGLARTLRSMVPVAGMAMLAAYLLLRDWRAIVTVSSLDGGWVAAVKGIFGLLFELAWMAGVLFLVWAGVDYALQRWQHEWNLRMSRQEKKDELRETEGPPEIRARQRRLRRNLREEF